MALTARRGVALDPIQPKLIQQGLAGLKTARTKLTVPRRTTLERVEALNAAALLQPHREQPGHFARNGADGLGEQGIE